MFEVTPPTTRGGNWTESTLWNFGNGTDGSTPNAGVIMDTRGKRYGTTINGGANRAGVEFKIANSGTPTP